MKVEIAGYPADKSCAIYKHVGEISGVEKTKSGGHLLYYDVDTTPGTSGTSINFMEEEMITQILDHSRMAHADNAEASINNSFTKMSIGVHTGEDPELGFNYGTLITPDISFWIENEVAKYIKS